MSGYDVNNPTLNEIGDPIVRTRLDEMQCMTSELASERDGVTKAIDQKVGIVQACKVLAKRLTEERGPVQKRVDDDGLDPDIAKAEITAINRCAAIVSDVGVENQADISTLRGKLQGIEASAKAIERRFATELAKYERHKRMEEEDEEEREERGRPALPASLTDRRAKKAVADRNKARKAAKKKPTKKKPAKPRKRPKK